MIAATYALAAVLAAPDNQPTVTLLEIIVTITTFAFVWTGCFLWAVRWFVNRHTETVDKGLAAISKSFEERMDEIRRSIEQLAVRDRSLEVAMLELRAEIAENYVRREDWIRTSAAIDAKLDSIREYIRDRGLARSSNQEGG